MQSCFRILPSSGGGDLSYVPKRNIDPADVILPPGFKIEPLATGLTFPTGVAFDDEGKVYVIEAGYSYGEVFLPPKLLRINSNGDPELVFEGSTNGPWNGITFYEGNFYIAEGGQLKGGRILKYNPSSNEAEVLVDNLPSLGDHHTNAIVIKDGYLYFSQGTATNSGVVGLDNADYGWLYRFPDFHDVPCKDIIVKAHNYTTPNVLTDDPDDKAVTGPFSPYNNQVNDGQVITGSLPCNGAVMRIPLEGGDLELVSWGFRNPYGMALSPEGNIFVTDNYYDVRGSRPIWGTGDLLWKVEQNKWYGWPDYYGQLPVEDIKVPGAGDPYTLLKENPGEPPAPVAKLGVHSSSNGLSFSHNTSFGFAGQAFIAQFGDMAPAVGKVLSPVGYKVVRVDVETGIIEDFAKNSLNKNGPASYLKTGGLERPVSVKFSPDGKALFVVDFGILLTDRDEEIVPFEKTGVLWKISKK